MMKSKALCMWTGLMALAFTSPVQAATGYAFSTFEELGGPGTFVEGLNNLGQAVGWSRTSDGIEHAVLWEGGTLKRLDESGPFGSVAHAINDQGVVAGYSMLSSSTYVATTWTNGQPQSLGSTNRTNSAAYAINNAGQVAGTAGSPYGGFDATVWRDGQQVTLNTKGSRVNGIGQQGRVIGSVYEGSGLRAAYWQDGQEVLLPVLGGTFSQVMAINAAGTMAGYSYTLDGNTAYATVWNDGRLGLLGTLSGYKIFQARGINSQGQIVGVANTGNFSQPYSESHAVLWIDGQAIDLNTLLDTKTVGDGWILENAAGINDAGWIYGITRNSITGESRNFLLSPVPEANTSAMLLLGLVTLAFVRHRRSAMGH